MDVKELIAAMRPDEIGDYLKIRQRQIGIPRVVDLARRLNIKPQQASDLIRGRASFGKRQIDRMNSIDPDFDLIELVGLVRKASEEKA